MAWSFLKKQGDFAITGSVLVLDIRSSSVAGAIVEFSKNKPPLISQTHREHYYFESAVEPEEFFKRSETALKKVLDVLIHKHNHQTPVASVEIFFGAPWYQASIANVKIEQTKPTECTDEFIDAIIKKDTSYNAEADVRVEKELIATLLNGYKVEQPIGKQATHFDFSFFTSVIAKEAHADFITIVRKYVRTQFVHTHTHPYAMLRVLDNALHAPRHYAIMDISGEMIELSIIKDDHFKKIISIPYGSHHFVRAYARLLSIDMPTALMKLNNAVHDAADEKVRTTQQSFLKDIHADMTAAVQKVFNAHSIELLPNVIFVAGDEEVRDLALYLLNEVEIYSGAFKINRKPTVQFIASDILKTYCAYAANARPDHQLAAEAVFVELLRVNK